MRGWTVLLLLPATACLRNTSFHCQTSDQCGTGGVCETSSGGYCAFADPICGLRYGASAGPYANQCVGGDGGIPNDGRLPDGHLDGRLPDAAPPNCPTGFGPLAGQTHYYKLISGVATWAAQQTACATQANTYLTIPDTNAELVALDGLAGAANTVFWVGVDDMQTLDVWVNVKNQSQTFLPWGPGEPNNGTTGQPRQCVAGIQASAHFQTGKCSDLAVAICECE